VVLFVHLYALRVLRAHSLSDVAIQAIFSHPCQANISFEFLVGIYDGVRIEGFVRRAKRSGFCSPDITSLNELCNIAYAKLLNADASHILNSLLPTTTIASQNDSQSSLAPSASNATYLDKATASFTQ
jgi:hypothetical protein